ncbi:hypothetical protein [Parageobacillus thermoglucosidasius]|uniref:hypothetical protein n=1 Tax=Parageobacillus thermoglucosidasius TaxID=1426 RepID=UPI001623D830|nr:hypothetical protein [Parageobacillus thermoglucosidasius]
MAEKIFIHLDSVTAMPYGTAAYTMDVNHNTSIITHIAQNRDIANDYNSEMD